MRTMHLAALCVVLLMSGVSSILGSDEANTTAVVPETTKPITTSEVPETTLTTELEPTTTVPPVPSSETTIVPPVPTTETTTIEPTTDPVPVTTGAPSTTKAPQPKPPHTEKGSWNITEGNVTCIKAELEVLFKIPIEDVDHYIAVFPNASASGNCELSNTTQNLILNGDNYELTIIFEKDAKNSQVFISNISLSYNLPDGRGDVRSDDILFTMKLGNSYLCKSEEDVKLENATMEIKYIQIQAFSEDHSHDFSTAEWCKADDKVSDAVPIAVGCALVALIVIVLIAYLVGRRRSRQRGYQSV